MRDTGKSGGKPGGVGGKGRKKREKGAARKFVTSFEEMTMRDEQEEQKQSARKARREDGENDSNDSEEESEDSEEETTSDEVVAFERVQSNSLFGFAQKADGPAVLLQEKKVGFAAIAKTQNPNMKKSNTKVIKAKDMDENAAPHQLSRREREAIEKERAAAYYLKKHLAGETDEAKKDLARLAEVKRRREEAEKRKKEEEDAAVEREKSSKKMQVNNDDEPLDARAIKALKPAVLKEKLKERNLPTQGQKKELVQRLLDYENERAL